MKRIRKKIFNIIEVSGDQKGPSWYFDVILISIIALNVVAIMLESVQSIYLNYQSFFVYFEISSVIFFTIEYVLRVWTSVEKESYRRPIFGRLLFMLTPLAIIDLLAILPFYLTAIIDLRFIRVLRLFRLFRLFKIVRYVVAIQVIGQVLKEKKEHLVLSILFILFMLLIVSSVMYYIENTAQPEVFSSIPETMWWGVATLTTVGYGDVYPITPLGKFLGGFIAILGIGLFALPTGIISSGFLEAMQRTSIIENKCPICGNELKDYKEE